VQQALRRLQEAADAMKKSSGAQPNPDAARQAAEQLRQAANLLAGTQQQLASSKVDSMANEAGRLTEQERSQAEQIDKLAARPQSSGPMDLNDTMARMRERDRLAQQRQQLSDDLSKLQKNIRDGAREMAPNQPEVARQLRDALTEMDNADLDNHTQRTADWLRRGVNPNSNGTETQIAQGLERLKEQLQQAQRAMGQQPADQRGTGHGAGQEADQTAALDAIERLRNQVESTSRTNGRQPGSGQDQQNGQRGGQQPGNGNGRSSDSLQRAQGGQGDAQPGRGAGGQAGSQQAGNAADQRGGGLRRSGDVGGPAGDIRNGDARGADGTVWGNVNTGNNQYGRGGPRPQADDPSGNYADTERAFQQEMRELNQLRQMVKGDPQAAKEAEDLARQMQHLDPSRFPGNPAIVEEMHREVLSSIDRLELEVERSGAATLASRTGKPQAVPEGYQDSVAEYYRQLSKSP
jgi:hypothetical protein